jgi:uracil phosphoribosyltransferase
MLATGNSSVHAVNVLLKRGAMEDNIKFLALVAAPEGVEVFFKAHPNIDLYVASVDEKLDKNAYIVPGLGDAGDRIFGTL